MRAVGVGTGAGAKASAECAGRAPAAPSGPLVSGGCQAHSEHEWQPAFEDAQFAGRESDPGFVAGEWLGDDHGDPVLRARVLGEVHRHVVILQRGTRERVPEWNTGAGSLGDRHLI